MRCTMLLFGLPCGPATIYQVVVGAGRMCDLAGMGWRVGMNVRSRRDVMACGENFVGSMRMHTHFQWMMHLAMD